MKFLTYSHIAEELTTTPRGQVVAVTLWSRWCDKCKPFLETITKRERHHPYIKFLAVEVDQLDTFLCPVIPSINLFMNGLKINESYGVNNGGVIDAYLGEWLEIVSRKQHPLLTSKPSEFGHYRAAILKAANTHEALSVKLRSSTSEASGELILHSSNLTNPKYIEQAIKPVKGLKSNYLYVVTAIGASKASIHLAKKTVEELKRANSDFSRINDSVSRTLYVGQAKGLDMRLRQHFGSRHLGTYALHMGRWGGVVDLRIRTNWYSLPEGESLSQAIEDAIWDELQPTFGRKGSR